MTRFDEHQTIDHLAEAGPLDPDLVDAIADTIAASHDIAPPAPAEPRIESIAAIIEGNNTVFRTVACFPAGDIDQVAEASLSALSRTRALLEPARPPGIRAALPWRPLFSDVTEERFDALRAYILRLEQEAETERK
jgi:aminoglycoside phosphotransferase family enzyme